jgi:hypothetical protein
MHFIRCNAFQQYSLYIILFSSVASPVSSNNPTITSMLYTYIKNINIYKYIYRLGLASTYEEKTWTLCPFEPSLLLLIWWSADLSL